MNCCIECGAAAAADAWCASCRERLFPPPTPPTVEDLMEVSANVFLTDRTWALKLTTKYGALAMAAAAGAHWSPWLAAIGAVLGFEIGQLLEVLITARGRFRGSP